ncbi:MAG: hypothetical protein VB046_11330 [Paludibacter sp.]|nr:hypothetical protein [Paludibacter sp.]
MKILIGRIFRWICKTYKRILIHIKPFIDRVLYNWKKYPFEFIKIVLISISIIAIASFIFPHINNFGIKDLYKNLLKFIFSLPAIVIIFSFFQNLKNKENNRIAEFNSLLNISMVYLTFCATFFIGLMIFRENPHDGDIPNFEKGSFGFHAWDSKVTIKSIKVSYQDDKTRNWITIPDSTIYKESNWDYYELNYNEEKEDNLIANTYPNPLKNNKDSIVLSHKTIIFNPKDNKIHNNRFHNIQIRCSIRFDSIFNNKKFQGFQILTFVNPIFDGKNNDVFLGFNFGYNGVFHPWIAAFDYEPPIKYLPSDNLKETYGGYNDIEKHKIYNISAIIMDEKVLFLGHDKGSVILFESKISQYK